MAEQFIVIEQNSEAYLVYGTDDTLTTLQTLVDGLIECVEISGETFGFPNETFDVWVNEEGLFRNDFTLNEFASLICCRPIVGPVVIARSKNGKTLGMTDDHMNQICEDGFLIDTNDGNNYTLDDFIQEFRTEQEAVR